MEAKPSPDERRDIYEAEKIRIHANVFVIAGSKNREERESICTPAHLTNPNSFTL